MADPARRRATYEDLCAVPDHLVAEIIDGELVTSPRPASPHARASTSITGELYGFDRGKGGPGGWVILDEPELHLHGDILVPDIAGWRRERMPEMPHATSFELPPDWVCETLSPSTVKRDRRDKIGIYRRERVEYVWLVEPIAQTLEAYQLDDRVPPPCTAYYMLLGMWAGDQRPRVPPFDAIELDLSALWAR